MSVAKHKHVCKIGLPKNLDPQNPTSMQNLPA